MPVSGRSHAMNMMMFPKMFASHGEGWNWVMRVHPSVVKLYLFYVAPMSLIPPAMLFYAWYAYSDVMPGNISSNAALTLVTFFYVVELVVVPVMGNVIQQIGSVAGVRPSYQDAFTMAAIVPTPLWLAPLFLFVPNVWVPVLAVFASLFGAGMLIYEGIYRVFQLQEEGHSLLLAGSIMAAGLVAWVAMLVMAFVSWGWASS
jgi:hypothetical protein